MITSRQVIKEFSELQGKFPAQFIEDYMALKSDTDKLIAVSNQLKPLFGDGSPEGVVKSNASQLYLDKLTNTLYINPDIDVTTGWVAV